MGIHGGRQNGGNTLKRILCVALFALIAAFAGTSVAGATFIPAAERTDMLYDFRRNVIYIANDDEILRYSLASNSFLPALALEPGTHLRGIDISRDGYYLAAADLASTADEAWVFLIDLRTLAVSKRSFTKGYYESGTWSVAFTYDNNLLVTSEFDGSGWVGLRRLRMSDGTWSTIDSVRQETMLSASTDRLTIAFAEANISDGSWGLYDVPTGQLVRRSGYTDGTSAFNFEIATDAMGGGFAIPTYDGLVVYDADYHKRWTMVAPGYPPVGVAWHPVSPLVYYPLAYTRQVRLLNANTGKLAAWYDIGDSFTWGGSGYMDGRTKLSADGSMFMVTTPGGVRYLRTYAPLAAGSYPATATSGVGTKIALKGSIGNRGALTYQAHGQPKHGSTRVSGAYATYKSAPGFKGKDSFRYMVRYGASAYAIGTVTVTVK